MGDDSDSDGYGDIGSRCMLKQAIGYKQVTLFATHFVLSFFNFQPPCLFCLIIQTIDYLLRPDFKELDVKAFEIYLELV